MMTCTYCGRGNVFFGDTCSVCGRTNRDNTQSLDQFWDHFKPRRRRSSSADEGSDKSFFRLVWAIPFKLLWLPVRLAWWLVKIPF